MFDNLIPCRFSKLDESVISPKSARPGDLWDVYAHNYDFSYVEDRHVSKCKNYSTSGLLRDYSLELYPSERVLIGTGLFLHLPIHCRYTNTVVELDTDVPTKNAPQLVGWIFGDENAKILQVFHYAVVDVRPRSGNSIKYGLSVANSPGTIDNSYRKELKIIVQNNGRLPITISHGMKLAQLLVRELKPSQMIEVDRVEDSSRGGFGSTGN